jgi:hypothetical protein
MRAATEGRGMVLFLIFERVLTPAVRRGADAFWMVGRERVNGIGDPGCNYWEGIDWKTKSMAPPPIAPFSDFFFFLESGL